MRRGAFRPWAAVGLGFVLAGLVAAFAVWRGWARIAVPVPEWTVHDTQSAWAALDAGSGPGVGRGEWGSPHPCEDGGVFLWLRTGEIWWDGCQVAGWTLDGEADYRIVGASYADGLMGHVRLRGRGHDRECSVWATRSAVTICGVAALRDSGT